MQEAQPFSVGSVGHPYSCSNPCKYVWRKRGCRDGTNCPNCHYCKWQRKPKDEEDEESAPTPQSSGSTVTPLANIPPPPGLELPASPPTLDSELQLLGRRKIQFSSRPGVTEIDLSAYKGPLQFLITARRTTQSPEGGLYAFCCKVGWPPLLGGLRRTSLQLPGKKLVSSVQP